MPLCLNNRHHNMCFTVLHTYVQWLWLTQTASKTRRLRRRQWWKHVNVVIQFWLFIINLRWINHRSLLWLIHNWPKNCTALQNAHCTDLHSFVMILVLLCFCFRFFFLIFISLIISVFHLHKLFKHIDTEFLINLIAYTHIALLYVYENWNDRQTTTEWTSEREKVRMICNVAHKV